METSAEPGESPRSGRQERLLDGLEAIFFEEGYRRVTVGALAARLHCSRRSLYELAATKEDLFRLVLDRMLTRVRREGDRAAAADAPLPDRIEAYLGSGITATRQATRAFSADILTVPSTRRVLEAHQEERMRGLRRLIEEGIDSGEFRGFDPTLVAEIFQFAWHRVLEPDFLAKTNLSLTEAYRELSQLLRHGLLHADAPDSAISTPPTKRRARKPRSR